MKTAIEIILAIYSALGVLSAAAHFGEDKAAGGKPLVMGAMILSLFILVISVVNLFL